MPLLFKTYLDDPDVQLMLKCQKGDTKAFEQLLDKYKSSLLNIIYRYIGNKVEAEDLAQEVFLKIYNSRRTYKPAAKFSTWLFRIATNLCLNQIRDTKKYTSGTISIDERLNTEDGQEPQQIADNRQVTPRQHLLEQELEEIVRQAIQTLPPNQRLAVILRRYQDLSYEEIAKTLNRSVLSVKALLFRAKETLRERLKNYV